MKLEELLEALKAVRDAGTNHAGLQALRRQLSRSRPAADAFLAAFLAASAPCCSHLHGVWEAQVSAKDVSTALELLAASTALLRYRPSASCAPASARAIAQGQDAFASSLIKRRLKALYFHLSSGNRARSNAALALLAALSARGGSVLSELVAAFDFSHAALPKLARPPKHGQQPQQQQQQPGGAAAAAADGGSEDGEQQQQPLHWQAWNSPQMGRRPSRALFVEWVASMLQAASPLLLPSLLHKRTLTCGLLHHLASDPPGVILGVLQLLQDRVLAGRAPAATQLELWSDGALEQLALVAAVRPAAAVEQQAADADEAAVTAAGGSGGTAEAQGSGSSSEDSGSEADTDDMQADTSEGGNEQRGRAARRAGVSSGDAAALEQQQLEVAAAQRVQQAAATAYDILLLLLTNAAHGLVPATAPAAARLQQVAAVASVGERRALRLLQRLQPGHSSSHARLLQAVADAHPQLAAELLQGLSYQLEPKPCGAWLGSAAAVMCLVAAAARAPLQLKQQVARTLAGLDGGGGSSRWLSAAAVLLPPESEGPAVRAAVRTCLPSALSKGLLSRGLQHPSPLVLSATLSLMQQCLAATQQLLLPIDAAAARVSAAAAAAAGDAVGSQHHKEQQQQAMQAGTQQLLQQHSFLIQQAASASVPSAAAAAASSWAAFQQQLRQQVRLKVPEVSVLVSVLTTLQRAGGTQGGGSSEQQLTPEQRELLLLQCCSVLQLYARWLPEAVADGHADLGKLLLQGQQGRELLLLSPAIQEAALRVLTAADQAAVAAAGDGGPGSSSSSSVSSMPVGLLLPLLRLAAASPSAQARRLAGQLLAARLAPFCSSSDEAQVWLQQLPQLWLTTEAAGAGGLEEDSGSLSSAAAAVCEQLLAKSTPADAPGTVDAGWLSAQAAVLSFVAEAAAAVERKPQEPWETAWAAVEPLANLAGPGSSSSSTPSLLAVCALRRLLRLLQSSKAAGSAKAAVCGYVCGVWQQLMLRQVDQGPSLLVLQHLVLEEFGSGAAAAAADDGREQRSKMHKAAGGDAAAAVAASPGGVPPAPQPGTPLALPVEAACIASLLHRLVALQAAVLQCSSVLPQQPLVCPVQSPDGGTVSSSRKTGSSKRRKHAAEDGAAAGLQEQQLRIHVSPVVYGDAGGCQQQLQQLVASLGSASAAAQRPGKKQRRASESAQPASGQVTTQHWHQLQLVLLCSSAEEAVQAGAAALECLLSDNSSDAAAAAQRQAGRQLLLSSLQSHGISAAHLVAASGSALEGPKLARLMLGSISCSNITPWLLQSSWEVWPASSEQGAAAAAPWRLLQEPAWRSQQLQALLALPLADKQRLAEPVVCSLLRVAAAVAAGGLKRRHAELLLRFGVQALQALMCAEAQLPAASAPGNSTAVRVHASVAATVLQHPALLGAFLGHSGAAAAAAVSRQLSPHAALLLAWLLQRGASAGAEGVPGAVVGACMPYIHKAVAAVQQELAGHSSEQQQASPASGSSPPGKAAKHAAGSPGSSQQCGAASEPSQATDACLQLLQAIAEGGGNGSGRHAAVFPAALQQLLEQLASSLLSKDGQQQQLLAAPLQPWHRELLLATARLLLLRPGCDRQQQPDGSRDVAAALMRRVVAMFVCSSSSSSSHDEQAAGLDALVAALLGVSDQPAAVLLPGCQRQAAFLQLTGQPGATSACLQQPLHPTRVRIAAQLMLWAAGQQQQHAAALREAFTQAFRHCAASVAGEASGSSHGNGQAAEARRERLALLLPAVAAYLPGVQRDSTSAVVQCEAAAAVDDCVVATYRPAMLAYLQQKQPQHKAKAGVQPSEAAACLQAHALPVLQACLHMQPLEAPAVDALLARLLPAKGYAVTAAAAASLDAPQPQQQLQLAAWLIQQQAAAGGGAGAPAAPLASLSAFIVCACATLAAVWKQQPSQAPAALEQLLVCQLNSWAGDMLAELPDELRTHAQRSAPGGTAGAGAAAFGAIVAALRQLALAVFKHRFGDSAALRCLRRLLAALLPGGPSSPTDTAPEAGGGAASGAADAAQEQQPNGGAGSSSDGSSDGSSDDSTETSSQAPADGMEVDASQPDEAASDDGRLPAASPSSSSDSSSDSSSSSSDDDDDAGASASDAGADTGMAEAGVDVGPAVVSNPAAAGAAHELLQLLVAHSGFVPTLLPQSHGPDSGQQQEGLPENVAAVATPLASYMPVVEAVWSCRPPPPPAAAGAEDDGGTSSSSTAAAKHQLVLLLEVLLDMARLFTSSGQQHQQQEGSGVPAGTSIEPALLQSLLQLLQVAHRATLSDCDRAVLRVLQLLDRLAPLDQQQDSSTAAGGSAGSQGGEEQQWPLPWPRCLFGPAAKLYYAHQHALKQQQQQPDTGAAADAEFEQQLLREVCPLDPLRAALTVVLFPDRRCLDPEAEPGDELAHLYYSSSGSSSSVSTHVCGAPGCVAAAAYDPVALLLLARSVLQGGVLEPDSFAASGLVGVVLRALAAEDEGLRGLAYDCARLLRECVASGQPAAAAAASDAPHQGEEPRQPPGKTRGGGGSTVQQLLRSSRLVHQLQALTSWVAAGVQQPLQQLPTASAVLAAEAALLLGAPSAPMGGVVRKLMLRQPALDAAGLPLFSRIMAGGSSTGAAAGGGGGSKTLTAGGGATGLRGVAAVMAERRWLLQLLWLGLRVPGDGQLYQQKRVCETLLCLWGTCHSDPALLPPDALAAAAAAGAGLDASIARLLCQAVRLPGLAGHLVRAAGLLPWLAAAAAVQESSPSAAGPGDGGGSWARDALRHLAAGGSGRRRQAVQQACVLAGLGGLGVVVDDGEA